MFCCEVDLWTVSIHFFLSFLQFHFIYFIFMFPFLFSCPFVLFLYIFILYFFYLFIFTVIYSTYPRQGLDHGKPNISLHLFYFYVFVFVFLSLCFIFIYIFLCYRSFIYLFSLLFIPPTPRQGLDYGKSGAPVTQFSIAHQVGRPSQSDYDEQAQSVMQSLNRLRRASPKRQCNR
jgi:hypothetical protein